MGLLWKDPFLLVVSVVCCLGGLPFLLTGFDLWGAAITSRISMIQQVATILSQCILAPTFISKDKLLCYSYTTTCQVPWTLKWMTRSVCLQFNSIPFLDPLRTHTSVEIHCFCSAMLYSILFKRTKSITMQQHQLSIDTLSNEYSVVRTGLSFYSGYLYEIWLR